MRVEALERKPVSQPVKVDVTCKSNSIGENIKAKRIASGYSQEGLAKIVGIKQPIMDDRESIKYPKKSLMDQKIHQAVGNLNEAAELLEGDDLEGALQEIVLAWQAVIVKLCQS